MMTSLYQILKCCDRNDAKYSVQETYAIYDNNINNNEDKQKDNLHNSNSHGRSTSKSSIDYVKNNSTPSQKEKKKNLINPTSLTLITQIEELNRKNISTDPTVANLDKKFKNKGYSIGSIKYNFTEDDINARKLAEKKKLQSKHPKDGEISELHLDFAINCPVTAPPNTANDVKTKTAEQEANSLEQFLKAHPINKKPVRDQKEFMFLSSYCAPKSSPPQTPKRQKQSSSQKVSNDYTSTTKRMLLNDNTNVNEISNMDQNKIVILDTEIKNARQILLEDVSGNLLFGEKLYIDAAGLKGSLRNKRDGFSFFGTMRENKGEIVNDFLINSKKEEDQRLFVIFFDRQTQKYYFKNMQQEKRLIYIKLDTPYCIENKKIFLIGQHLLCIEPNYRDGLINIKYASKSEKKNSNLFTFSTEDSPVTIGRKNGASIVIDGDCISKKHSTLEYDIIFKIWMMIDGYEGKKSSHGTWLLVDSKFELTPLTTVRVGSNVIKASTFS